MNVLGYVASALELLKMVEGNLPKTGVTAEISQATDDIQSAIASLQKVMGTEVTYQQLEGLRVQKTW